MIKFKKITDYVPAGGDRRLLQVRIEEGLREEVNRQREADGLSWQQLIEACFRRYLDERKGTV